MIAISEKDYKDFGCVNCGCDFVFNNGGICGCNIMVECAECKERFFILKDGFDKTNILFFNSTKGIYEHLPLKEHPRIGIYKHSFVQKDIRPGNDIGEFCKILVTGDELIFSLCSKECANRIKFMFEEINNEYNEEYFKCTLDCSPDLTRIWIKINYKDSNSANKLVDLILENGVITKDKIVNAVMIGLVKIK